MNPTALNTEHTLTASLGESLAYKEPDYDLAAELEHISAPPPPWWNLAGTRTVISCVAVAALGLAAVALLRRR